MSFSPKIRKHLYPVLKNLGFSYGRPWWRLTKDRWTILVELSSSKHGDTGMFHLEVDIGFFSHELDDLMGWGREAGFTKDTPIQMPNGIAICHFQASLFDLDESRRWRGLGECVYLTSDGDAEFSDMAHRLERVIPKAFDHYASLESVVQTYIDGIGLGSKSKQSSMFAAAACMKLERYDEAKKFLEIAVRPGSVQFMKNVGSRLTEKIEEAE